MFIASYKHSHLDEEKIVGTRSEIKDAQGDNSLPIEVDALPIKSTDIGTNFSPRSASKFAFSAAALEILECLRLATLTLPVA